MENELKPAASLSARLLARKGEAAPAESKLTYGIRAEASHLPLSPSMRAPNNGGAEETPQSDEDDRANLESVKRPVGAGDRIAMTLRLSHAEHTRLKILAAKLKRSSQEIMLDALREFISGQDFKD